MTTDGTDKIWTHKGALMHISWVVLEEVSSNIPWMISPISRPCLKIYHGMVHDYILSQVIHLQVK